MVERDLHGNPELAAQLRAEALFTSLVHQVGPQALGLVLASFEDRIEGSRGVVAFPEDEYKYGVSVSDDGQVNVQYGREERFHVPVERAQEIIRNITEQNSDVPTVD